MVSGNARATVQMLADTDRLSADGERGEREGVTWNAGMYVNYLIVPSVTSSERRPAADGVALAAAAHKKWGNTRQGQTRDLHKSPLKLMDGDHGQAFNGRIRVEDAGFECQHAGGPVLTSGIE